MKTRPAGAFLEPITGTVKRKRFAVFDIESKADDTQEAGFTRPFMVGVYDPVRDEYEEFRDEPHLGMRDWTVRYWLPGGCIDKLLNYLLTPKFKGWVFYAHNGGNFDHLFLLSWLRSHSDEFGFEIVPVQSSIQSLRVWRLPDDPEDPIRERWEFLDSMKLLPMGLERACQTFGLPGKVEHDLHMHESDERWSVYLKQDCLALATVMSLFYDMVENKLGGEVGMTAPSTSMKLFRRKYLKGKVPRHVHWTKCNDSSCEGCAHEWIRRGYYGGRTEPFRLHGENLRYYDINSSYVAAMKEPMPGGERVDHEGGGIDWRMLDNYVGFAECLVHIPDGTHVPPLPHRHQLTGKLVFPSGYFGGVWDVDELSLLDSIPGAHVVDTRRVVWFRKRDLFSEMVGELWGLRDKGRPDYDEGLSQLAKLLGNSLYGKFGMRTDRTTVTFTKDVPQGRCFLCGEETGEEGSSLCRGCEGSKPANCEPSCEVWYQHKKVEAAYIIPHIAAHITALARIRIWRFMMEALQAGGDIYYTDTDSIITDAVLPSSTELGALKDEYPGVTMKGTFLQPKVYMLESEAWEKPKVTAKGLPRSLRTKENLEDLRSGKTVQYMNLEKVRTMARLGFSRGPRMRVVKKSFKSGYDKRQVIEGGRTKALYLDERADWFYENK